ncbi:glycine zipper 2TM domain-containing protein [Sphingomonas sp. PB4P5]|uniref:glycine zipper 2TM domain-containing protein n=1 Tax=Parasphingomonas puruogangriensis TaxID=3096155 RepID=UPI002FC9801D
MKTLALLPAFAAGMMALAAPATAQTAQDSQRFAAAQSRLNNELQTFRAEFDRYQAAVQRRGGGGGYRDAPYNDSRNDPRYNSRDDDDYSRAEPNYDPSRYYRDGNNYQERTLRADERVYAGNDGRYYCKRSDGTTGLILGAAGGGILGNVIDGGRSRVVGTLLGGALGAVAGKAVDQNQSQVRCR